MSDTAKTVLDTQREDTLVGYRMLLLKQHTVQNIRPLLLAIMDFMQEADKYNPFISQELDKVFERLSEYLLFEDFDRHTGMAHLFSRLRSIEELETDLSYNIGEYLKFHDIAHTDLQKRALLHYMTIYFASRY